MNTFRTRLGGLSKPIKLQQPFHRTFTSAPPSPSFTHRALGVAWKSTKLIVGITTIGVAGTVAYQTFQDPTFPKRLHRAYRIWGSFAPIYVDYKWGPRFRGIDIDDEAALNAEYERLHAKHASTVADLALELRGAWIKLCQAVAARPELAPEEYRNALAPLMDSVPALGFSELEDGVCRELGVSSLDELFESVDRDCLGAASVSQVHGAVLRTPTIVVDSPGAKPREVKDVVLKIRYPDAISNFSLDLATMAQIITLARPQLLPAQKEVEKMVKRELDFREEAASLTTIGDAVRNEPRFDGIVIPHAIPGLCSSSVIVMERMVGGKLETRVRRHYESLAEGMGTTVDAIRDKLVGGFRGGSELKAMELLDSQGWFGTLKSVWTIIGPRTLLNLSIAYLKLLTYETIGWWLPPFLNNLLAAVKLTTPMRYPDPPLPVRTGKLYNSILAVHGFEILELGWWNADPHPGNIFLAPDGTVALLDYGATSKLPDSQRLALARLILELGKGEPDKTKIAAGMVELGFSFAADFDAERGDEIFVRIATGLFTARGFGTGRNHPSGRPKLESVPDQFFLVARTVGLLRGLGIALGMGRVDLSRAWAESARRALE